MRITRALLLIFLIVPLSPARAIEPAVDVYAHRGGAGLAPENTLGAFRQAHAMFPGVWLELDTQLAADGEMVVIHDDTLDRTTTNCSGTVMSKTSEQLATCDARRGWPSWESFEHVPTLREVLVEGKIAGWKLLIELKNIPYESNFDPTGAAVAGALVALLDETGYPAADIGVQSFFPTSLDQIELARPDIATALLTIGQVADQVPGSGFPAASNGAYATARGYEISAPDHRSIDLSGEVVTAMQASGREVVVWTVDDPADIARALGWGVDGIISNRPDRVYAAL